MFLCDILRQIRLFLGEPLFQPNLTPYVSSMHPPKEKHVNLNTR